MNCCQLSLNTTWNSLREVDLVMGIGGIGKLIYKTDSIKHKITW